MCSQSASLIVFRNMHLNYTLNTGALTRNSFKSMSPHSPDFKSCLCYSQLSVISPLPLVVTEPCPWLMVEIGNDSFVKNYLKTLLDFLDLLCFLDLLGDASDATSAYLMCGYVCKHQCRTSTQVSICGLMHGLQSDLPKVSQCTLLHNFLEELIDLICICNIIIYPRLP